MKYDGWLTSTVPTQVQKIGWTDEARAAAAASRGAKANGAPSQAAQHALHHYGWDHSYDGAYTHSDPAMSGHKLQVSLKPTPQYNNRPHVAWTHETPDGHKYEGAGVNALQSHLMYQNQRANIGSTRTGHTMPGRS